MEHNGFQLFTEAIDNETQARLVAEVMTAQVAAPFYRPVTPSGKPMSVEQTNLGPLGWVTDRQGYRYQAHHPLTGRPWPPMPPLLLALWDRFAGAAAPPDACLVNRYRDEARMGLHQDADEADLTAPVMSISLGDTAIFRLGGPSRKHPTRSFRLASGDICVLAGTSRGAFHGVDRILAGGSRLIADGGRLNLTLRRALA
jgi:alkylated DNA repair protein (DNA oxidative demethylase)